MKESGLFVHTINFFAVVRFALILIVLAVLAIALLGVPLPVSGQSMEPNFQTGQIVLVSRLGYSSAAAIKRGDVVAAKFPADPNHTKLIKRVVGLPGETIHGDQGKIYLNGQLLSENYQPRTGIVPYDEAPAVTLKESEYFLVGDNRPGSSDSRLWGPVVRSDIQGRVSFVIWPFTQAQYLDRVSY